MTLQLVACAPRPAGLARSAGGTSRRTPVFSRLLALHCPTVNATPAMKNAQLTVLKR